MELRTVHGAIFYTYSFPRCILSIARSTISPCNVSTKHYRFPIHRVYFHSIPPNLSDSSPPSRSAAPSARVPPLPSSKVENRSGHEMIREQAAQDLGWTAVRPIDKGKDPRGVPYSMSQTASSASTFPDPSPTSKLYGSDLGTGVSDGERRERVINGGSSSSDILRAIQRDQAGKSQAPSSGSFGPRTVFSPNTQTFLTFDNMMNVPRTSSSPDLPHASGQARRELGQQILADDIHSMPRVPKQHIKLEPKLGRTINMTASVDLPKAIELLEKSCARNKVKRDEKVQSRHERRGAKVKRLRGERWRLVFHAGFRATIRRITELRSQGW